uniref:Tyrosine aminotransferase n=2 Tax=Lepeophtheirus salmonis TaxID=72036 RepID=A0A0K2SYQ4_LEPSM
MSPISSNIIASQSMAKQWKIQESDFAKNTFNPIRSLLKTLKGNANPSKDLIDLSLGDPTVFGNLKPHENIIKAFEDSLRSGKYNGYGPSTGHAIARKAVAEHVSIPGAEVTADDVILTSGCSTALDHCITVLAGKGQNILVPRPAFPLYKTLADGFGIESKEYSCIPERNWEIDLQSLEDAIDENTAAIVVNNPSNPCGAAFSPKHLKDVIRIAELHKIPIIADEIYDYFTFSDDFEFVPMASLTSEVPILSCGGLTKRFLVPGWRLGWLVIYDRNNLFLNSGITNALERLTQRQIGPNTVVQGALPAILKETPKEFHSNTISVVKSTAEMVFRKLEGIQGLNPIMPSGAMYMMVHIDSQYFPQFSSDMDFVKKLIEEESVFPLPGKCFNCPNFFRIVLTTPASLFETAFERLEQFCNRHRVPSKSLKLEFDGGFDSTLSMSSFYQPDTEEFHRQSEASEDEGIKLKKNVSSVNQMSMFKKRSVVSREA